MVIEILLSYTTEIEMFQMNSICPDFITTLQYKIGQDFLDTHYHQICIEVVEKQYNLMQCQTFQSGAIQMVAHSNNNSRHLTLNNTIQNRLISVLEVKFCFFTCVMESEC